MLLKDDNIMEAFNFFDRDCKGYFTSNDFKQAIGNNNLSFGSAYSNFKDVFEEAFPGQDKITFEMLKSFMMEGCPSSWDHMD